MREREIYRDQDYMQDGLLYRNSIPDTGVLNNLCALINKHLVTYYLMFVCRV